MNINYPPYKKYVRRPLDMPGGGDKYITFKDDNVLVALGKSKLSFTEAASMFYLGGSFVGNENIVSFDEFKLFTGIRALSGPNVFEGCSNLETITIPRSVNEIAANCFKGCYNLKKVVFIGDVKVPRSYFEDCPNVVIEPPMYGVGWDHVGIDFTVGQIPSQIEGGSEYS